MLATGLTIEQKEELAAHCLRSPVEFCRIFLPHWFPTKMPWVHRGILALLENRTDFLFDFGEEEWQDGRDSWTVRDLEKIITNFVEEIPQGAGQKSKLRPIFTMVEEDGEPKLLINCKSSVGIIMPRGSSKTTLVNAFNLKDILYKICDFFLYASETKSHAERQLGTIRFELEDNNGLPNNELIISVFGEHQPSRQSNLKWTENYIETLGGIMVGAVGTGGQVRGFGKRAKRPKRIIYDDLQDDESIKSEEQRKKDSGWFFRAARPAKAKGGRDIIIGTLLHPTEGILNKVMTHDDFTVVRFGAVDRQGDALWDWYLTLEDIAKKKKDEAAVGELLGFYLEYMSEYISDDTKMFPESKIVYVSRPLHSFVALSLVNDPAITEDRKGDMCAFAVSGIEHTGHKHILDFYGKIGMDPYDLIEKYFQLHFQWMQHLEPEYQKHGVEAIAYQRALIPIIRQHQVIESKKWGSKAYFEVTPILHGKIGKVPRIKGILKPLIWAGQLSFEQRWGDLHNQLVDFPSTDLKDGPDVCAMSIALLDPFVTLNLNEDDGEGNIAAVQDFAKDSLPSLNSGWRRAP